MATSSTKVNAALKAAGIPVVMYRSPSGYYYFDDATTQIQSIYSYRLSGYSTEDIVEHVRSELRRIDNEG